MPVALKAPQPLDIALTASRSYRGGRRRGDDDVGFVVARNDGHLAVAELLHLSRDADAEPSGSSCQRRSSHRSLRRVCAAPPSNLRESEPPG
jgi:hypothetical protein